MFSNNRNALTLSRAAAGHRAQKTLGQLVSSAMGSQVGNSTAYVWRGVQEYAMEGVDASNASNSDTSGDDKDTMDVGGINNNSNDENGEIDMDIVMDEDDMYVLENEDEGKARDAAVEGEEGEVEREEGGQRERLGQTRAEEYHGDFSPRRGTPQRVDNAHVQTTLGEGEFTNNISRSMEQSLLGDVAVYPAMVEEGNVNKSTSFGEHRRSRSGVVGVATERTAVGHGSGSMRALTRTGEYSCYTIRSSTMN